MMPGASSAPGMPRLLPTTIGPEVDAENETVGYGEALPLERADGAGAGHEADTQEAQRGVQSLPQRRLGTKVALAAIKSLPLRRQTVARPARRGLPNP
jgi:hypothetical protein